MSVIARFPKSDPPLTALVTAEFVPQDKKTGIKFTPKNDKDQEITELAFFPQGYKHPLNFFIYFVSSARSQIVKRKRARFEANFLIVLAMQRCAEGRSRDRALHLETGPLEGSCWRRCQGPEQRTEIPIPCATCE